MILPAEDLPVPCPRAREEIEALDVFGLGARLTSQIRDADPDSPGSVFADSRQWWFDSVREHLAEQRVRRTAGSSVSRFAEESRCLR
ncbi:hypothetical protein [Streptomyces sp. NPDC060002]|uniref:hypothetical protein n=1 Tax=Streptomyces sp. NPDC060002 TaxID=3347033 RepID=UPI0036A75729